MVDLTSEAAAIIESPLGPVLFRVDRPSGVTAKINRNASVRDLPKGMAVDEVILISVEIATPVTRKSPLLIDLAFDHEGYAESGEWLDSVAFLTDSGVMHVAVRDELWLAEKGIVAEIEYRARGLRQTILEAAAGTTIYGSVAWRLGPRPDGEDCSTWFAADLALPI